MVTASLTSWASPHPLFLCAFQSIQPGRKQKPTVGTFLTRRSAPIGAPLPIGFLVGGLCGARAAKLSAAPLMAIDVSSLESPEGVVRSSERRCFGDTIKPSHAMAFGELPNEDWYSILNAEPSDSLTELKRKYQKLVLLYHPDKQSADVPAGEVEARMQRFIEIDRAWKILGNEETKKEYDLQRREHELTQVFPVDAQVSLQDMAWNCNDQSYSLICRCGGNYTISKNEAEDVTLVCCDTCSLVIEILR